MNLDEYYCPHCGATLNDQYGFDSQNTHWTCMQCGKELYGDDVYEGEVYPGVMWYCDNCGDLLNAQEGFHDSYPSWTCTNCWYSNELSENNIYESEASYQTDLRNRTYQGNDNSDDLDEDNDVYETDDDDDETEDDDGNLAYSISNSSRPSSYSYYHSPSRRVDSAESSQNETDEKNTTVIILALIVLVVLVGMLNFGRFSGFQDDEETVDHTGEIKLTSSADSYKDENYYDAIIKLNQQGLTVFRLTPLNDLVTGLFSKEGTIATIEINSISDFSYGTWVKQDSIVSITFHSFEKKQKDGFDSEKNNHLIYSGADISLPSYLIEEKRIATAVEYYVADDRETRLIVNFGDRLDWDELGRYDTHYVLEQQNYISSIGGGELITGLGKKNNTIYSVKSVMLDAKESSVPLQFILSTPNNNRMDYTDDFNAIISGIYYWQESEIRIDFSPDDYKGKNYEDVLIELKNKGFKNIQTQNLQDVLIGWFLKEGTVDSVMINGKTDYRVGDWIEDMTEIVINYHGKKES